MKRGTRAAVFFVSAALTAGTLFATLGPRHCYKGGCGMYSHCDENKNCSDTKNNTTYPSPDTKTK